MKNRIVNIALSLLLLGSFASCSDFLDLKPLDTYSDISVFSDTKNVENFVNTRYTELRNGWGQTAMRFVCDESYNNFNWYNAYTLNTGAMTPDQMGGFDIWSPYYTSIKNCNIFFENIGRTKGDASTITRLTGEMQFIRAYLYADLVRRYGGVPLITKTMALNGDLNLKRNSYEECIKFIADECDAAAKVLPTSYTGADFGRATKGAALALKSRMLLYAASPLWNTANDKSKWQAAADAAKAVIDLNIYSLDSDYKGLFLNSKSSEIIFERLYTSQYGHFFDMNNSPNGYHGWSATCVLQDMVDSYEMEDGTMPTADLYTKADGINSTPWEHRDPRFYASILCDGQQFRGRPVEFWCSTDITSASIDGLDSEFGIDNWNHSKTHYTIRKFMDEKMSITGTEQSSHPWVYSRLAEIYLNYAEAQYNLGNEGVARDYVNKIRARARGGKAGILPDVTATGADLLKAIQHERKIELAFEEHRFFDVRRWKIADVTENLPAHKLDILRDFHNGVKTYTISVIQDRKFLPQHYLLPIPRTEMQRDPLLVQNPNYN